MVSIIMAVYNQIGYTRQCLQSLVESTNSEDYEIILVDNGSTDGSKDIFSEFPGIGYKTVVVNKENIGATRAWNQGCRAGRGEYLFVINNDIVFPPDKDWLPKMTKFLDAHSEVGVASPQLCGNGYFDDDPICLPQMNPTEFKEKWGGLVADTFRWGMHGCFMMMKKETFKYIGEFDEWYSPGGCEDADYLRRCTLAGLVCVTYQNVLFYHFGAVTQSITGHGNHEMGHAWHKYRQKWGTGPEQDELWALYNHIQNERTSLNNTRRSLGLKIWVPDGTICRKFKGIKE